MKCRHRRAGRWDPSSPDSVMFRRGAHSLPLSQDSEAAEKALGEFEGAVDQVLRDLLERLDRVGPGRESYEVGTWKPSEEELLREFLVLQYSRPEVARRSLTRAKSADELAEELADDVKADPELSGKVEVNRPGVGKIHQHLLVPSAIEPGGGEPVSRTLREHGNRHRDAGPQRAEARPNGRTGHKGRSAQISARPPDKETTRVFLARTLKYGSFCRSLRSTLSWAECPTGHGAHGKSKASAGLARSSG